MRRKISWTLLLGAALLAGCGKQVPKKVIQPGEMESILYDYHLTTAMSGNISHTDNYKKEALRTYVFKKHNITQAEFDSSMVWYTRHTEDLAKIYTNLGKRFRAEKKGVQKLLAVRENKASTSLPGDTVEVWYNKTLFWLTDAPLANKVTFVVPADSNFKEKDAFRWSADYIFLSGKKQQVTMGFNVLFDNDSVMGRVEEITGSGVHTLYIKPDSAYKIKSVNGFIYLANDSTGAPGVIVDKLSLMRYHEVVDSTAVVPGTVKEESVPTDTVATIKEADTTKVEEIVTGQDVPVRLNPRDMKEKEKDAARPQRTRTRRTN